MSVTSDPSEGDCPTDEELDASLEAERALIRGMSLKRGDLEASASKLGLAIQRMRDAGRHLSDAVEDRCDLLLVVSAAVDLYAHLGRPEVNQLVQMMADLV